MIPEMIEIGDGVWIRVRAITAMEIIRKLISVDVWVYVGTKGFPRNFPDVESARAWAKELAQRCDSSSERAPDGQVQVGSPR